jgi:hypothetical protein
LFSADMFPFSIHTNLLMACHFTGIYDVNRTETLPDDDYSLVKDWAASVAAHRLNGIIFHNNFTEATCAKYQNDYVKFVRREHSTVFNPNVYRYFIYRDYLRAHAGDISHLFITDVSDVVVLSNPFYQPLFLANPAAIFCGDEPKCLDNVWMKAHSAHLRSSIDDYAAYEDNFKAATLLNCGIIGGSIAVMQSFIEQLCTIHQEHNCNNPTAYTGDMGAFNYLLRTRFNEQICHGEPVNTLFKGYEHKRTDCWFRHK